MIGKDAAMFGRKAVGDGRLERLQRLHLTVEPALGAGTKAVRPAQPGAHMAYAEIAQPANRVIQAMVFEMKPLADSERGRVLVEVAQRQLRSAVFPQQTHVEMPIVGGPFGFAMTRGRRPGRRPAS